MTMATDADPSLDALTVEMLRRLFRNLVEWRSMIENTVANGTGEAIRMESLTDNDGNTWNIWDVERLYAASQTCLTPRQAQSIRFFLVLGLSEREVAAKMGIDPENPIGMYATDGLKRLIALYRERMLPNF